MAHELINIILIYLVDKCDINQTQRISLFDSSGERKVFKHTNYVRLNFDEMHLK